MLRRLGFFSLMLLAGCSSIAAPSIEVASMSLTERTDEAQLVLVRLRLSNPNDEAVELRDVSYQVHAASATISGRRASLMTLPARGQSDLVVPAVLQIPAGAAEPDSGTISGSLTYLAPGALAEQLFDLGVRKPKVGFSGTAAIQRQE